MNKDIVDAAPAISDTVTITINGKELTLTNIPRLKWADIANLAGIPTGPRGKWTNNSTVTVKAPGEDARPHYHGFSLIVVDGMEISAKA
jgi:hypothetical protein